LNQSVADITSTNYYAAQPNIIVYYELLDISIIELETKKSLKVIWTGRHNKEETTHSFLLPKTHTFGDVAETLAKSVKLSAEGSGKIRIFDISQNGRTQHELTISEMIGNLQDPAEVFAEEIPNDELAVPEAAKVVNMFHYAKEPSRTHGVPCRFVLYRDEVFSDTKKRIQQRIGASEKEFARFKFSLVSTTLFKQPSIVEEPSAEDVLYDHKWQPDDAIGLDHPDRRPNKSTAERGIVMR